MWRKVVFLLDCSECPDCGEPICPQCGGHYADCDCPGPMQDDEFDYRTDENGDLIARPKRERH